MTERGGERAKRRWGRLFLKAVIGCVLVILLLAAVAGLGAYMLYDHVMGPGVARETVDITVPRGATGRDIGRLLAEKGFVDNEHFFRIAMYLDSDGGAIKHGPYALPRGLAPMELLRILQDGPNRHLRPGEVPDELKLTMPEGLPLSKLAELFDHPATFLEAASDPALIDSLGLETPTLEGFLMPDTYYFDEPPTPQAAVARAVEHFDVVYAGLCAEIPGAEKRDKLEVVIIASLIEEEARVDEERPLVAAVIYNRLERGIPLAMDSTLQYALGKYGQRMLNADKETDSPYNTYRHKGLPPGPISNPGAASLRAALAPADADYLYFVSNADGKTHTFSRTQKEHNRAVARYRNRVREQRKRLQEAH